MVEKIITPAAAVTGDAPKKPAFEIITPGTIRVVGSTVRIQMRGVDFLIFVEGICHQTCASLDEAKYRAKQLYAWRQEMGLEDGQ